MVADSHMLQLKVPPARCPLPVTRVAAIVACGAPVVEVLAGTSVWAVQLLKAISACASHRGLVAIGIGAVSNCATAAFTRADANRYAAVLSGGDAARIEHSVKASLFRACVIV